MESKNRSWVLRLPVILTGLMGGCSSGAHSAASHPPEPRPLTASNSPSKSNPPIYLASLTCWDTVSCCVERNPFTAVENCGADPARIANILKTLAEIYATLGSPPATEATQDQADAAAARKDGTPAWKRKCIMTYVECQQRKWVGNCHACFRRCEGQHKWPDDMCYDPRKQN